MDNNDIEHMLNIAYYNLIITKFILILVGVVVSYLHAFWFCWQWGGGELTDKAKRNAPHDYLLRFE